MLLSLYAIVAPSGITFVQFVSDVLGGRRDGRYYRPIVVATDHAVHGDVDVGEGGYQSGGGTEAGENDVMLGSVFGFVVCVGVLWELSTVPI